MSLRFPYHWYLSNINAFKTHRLYLGWRERLKHGMKRGTPRGTFINKYVNWYVIQHGGSDVIIMGNSIGLTFRWLWDCDRDLVKQLASICRCFLQNVQIFLFTRLCVGSSVRFTITHYMITSTTLKIFSDHSAAHIGYIKRMYFGIALRARRVYSNRRSIKSQDRTRLSGASFALAAAARTWGLSIPRITINVLYSSLRPWTTLSRNIFHSAYSAWVEYLFVGCVHTII